MPNIFWNKEEKRVRAFWRFFAFLWISILLGLLATGLGLGVGLAVMAGEPAGGAQELFTAALHAYSGLPFVLALDTALNTLAVLATLWLAGKWLDRRPFAAFGFRFSRAWWTDFVFGLGLGAALMGLIFAVELAAGWVRVDGFLQSARQPFGLGIFNALVLFIGVGIREEVLFRGYPLRAIAEGMNWKRIGPRGALLIAFIFTSVVFGLAHLTNPNATWISSASIALAGFLLGIGYVLTGELAIPIGLHISWNFFQGNVFGFPVSGTNAGVALIDITQGGPDLVTGGAFGPEAGLIGLAAMALGFFLTVVWVKWRTGKAELDLNLAVYQPPARQ